MAWPIAVSEVAIGAVAKASMTVSPSPARIAAKSAAAASTVW
jgi:hypothetical protein